MRAPNVRRFAVVAAVVLLAGAAVLVATTLPQRDNDDDEMTPAEAAGFADVIWTYSDEQTLRAAHALHRVGATPDTASESLPKPVPGALDGTGRCPATLESGGN